MAASTGEPHDPTEGALLDHLDRLEEKHGERVVMDFADRAYGRSTPLQPRHLRAFMASRGELKVDTQRRYTGPMKALAAWLKNNHLPQTIQAIDRRVAIRYVDHLSPGRPDPKRLSLYWQWMVKREHAASGPRRDLSICPQSAPRA